MRLNNLPRLLRSTALLAALLTFPLGASATTIQGYVCSVTVNGAGTVYGSLGHLIVELSTSVSCTTTSKFYLCSQGASSSRCVRFPAGVFEALFHGIQRASANEQAVVFEYLTNDCNATYCWIRVVNFLGTN